MNYEYGVRWEGREEYGPHRTGMTEQEAIDWVKEFYEELPNAKPGLVYVIFRELSDWQNLES